jgi:iron complex outermembrane receptor protein
MHRSLKWTYVFREEGYQMSKLFMRSLCASTALTLGLPTAAMAQAAPAEDSVSEDGAIIVTARRADEKLQDVPVSVQAISGSQLQKLSITSADELSKLAPGLTLVNSGPSTAIILRGVAWKPGSGTPATPLYFNEAPFDPGNTVVSLFDIGQIEVLRGPQGTSRGAPSISGAITVSTKKPDLTEFGGFVQGLYGSANHWDVQAGINAPIIKDVLAIRLATNIENSEGDRIYSVHSTIKPRLDDRSYRATMLFKPVDTLSIQAMYQRRTTEKLRYDQVVGTGSPGAARSATFPLGGLDAIPANFNGPALTLAQRASVEDVANTAHEKVDLLSVNVKWEVLGHQLSYNYGRQWNRGSSFSARDPLNMLPGFEPTGVVPVPVGSKFTTQELRLSSTPNPDRPFDYDIGWFSKHSSGSTGQNLLQYLPGAFGAPNAQPGAVALNPKYVLPVALSFPIGQMFDSFYGNIRFHIDENTELAGGLAIVRDRAPVGSNTVTGAATASAGLFQALKFGFITPGSPLLGVHTAVGKPLPSTCEDVEAIFKLIGKPQGFYTSTTYAGVCDVPVPAGSGNSSFSTNPKYTAALYNFSLSHKFSEDVMVYATTGSSYRSGLPALGSVGLSDALLVPKPETAKSYELGIKTSFGRGLHINASVFQIDYKDQLTQFQNVTYWNQVSLKADLTSLAFYRNVNSRVRGFEIEVAAQPTDNLSLGANISYSQIKSQGGLVPANPGDCAGAVAVSGTNLINQCASAKGQILNQSAPFSATVNGSYTVPLGSFEGYFRFNLSYQGKNPNFGNFSTAGVFKSVPSYAILDLFAGVAGERGVWDLGFFAKNVFDKQVELGRVTPKNDIYSPFAAAAGGYDQVRTSTPREIGVTLRYAFGSR